MTSRDDRASRSIYARDGRTLPAIVLIGPESTGKTTLAERLAQAYCTTVSLEFGRRYVDARHAAGIDAPLGPEDVEPIADGQIAAEDAAAADAVTRGRRLVIRDTDLVSTMVYARHYYGTSPRWIEAAARVRRGVLYLLCAPDVPWIPDDVRDRPQAREALLNEFRATLDALACPYVELRGDWAAREAAARAAIDQLDVVLGSVA